MNALTDMPDYDELPAELPHSIEAEQALLGALMVNHDAYDEVSAVIVPEHFYETLHARIFEACSVLVGQGKQISPVTLKPSFEHDTALKEVGGMGYLARLAAAAVATPHAKDYAKAIVDLASRRSLIFLGQDMQARGENMPIDVSADDALDEAEERLFALRSQFRGRAHQGGMIGAYATKAVEAAEQAARLDEIPGLPTGIALLDEQLRLRNGHMIVMAGRPGSGKSSLALTAALNNALAGRGVYFASLEMPGEELSARGLSCIASNDGGRPIQYFRIERGQLTNDELTRLRNAEAVLADLPIFFDTRRAIRVAQIAAGARRFAKRLRRNGQHLALIVIDHIGKVRDSGRWGSDKTNSVAEISSDIHTVAGDMNLPVVAVSQLNRAVESRDDKRPTMSDIRASGNIEEDAHLILTVFRPAYYLERDKPSFRETEKYAEWESAMARARHDMHVTIAKQRGGPTGDVQLWADIHTNRFGEQR